ncbi:MAG: metallophosphoesterase [Nitrosopumilaceae archaeon]|nr:metallophosphoesterase [Nitrosopumilaceae archaeon]
MDLVFSDIHADINALDTILNIANLLEFKKKYGEYSRIINLGDILERGTHPSEVLKKLTLLEKTYSLTSIMGNHDEAFLYKRPVSGSTLESFAAHQSLTENELGFFKQNDDETFGHQQFIDKKNGLVFVHGGTLDPQKITPLNAGQESWLYQRTWQRLSEEDFEYFSYSGYHYTASSAFKESRKNLDNFVILCGHQHLETAIEQDNESINEIYNSTKTENEKFGEFSLGKKEFEIKNTSNYLIRLGLGGPEGYYGNRFGQIHFGIIQYNPKKVILFTVT